VGVQAASVNIECKAIKAPPTHEVYQADRNMLRLPMQLSPSSYTGSLEGTRLSALVGGHRFSG